MDPLITPMLIGMGVNALRTGIQAGKTKGLKSAYETAEAGVNPVDPNQVAFMNRLRTQEQRFRAGTDPSSAFAAQSIQQQGAQTQRNMMRMGGPGAVGNMLRAQQGTNQGMAQVGAQAAGMGNQLLGMQGGLVNLVAERTYDLQRDRRNQAMARYEQNRQDVWNGISGLTATLPGLAMGMGGGGGAVPNSVNAAQINASLPADRLMMMGGSPGDAMAMQPTFPQAAPLSYQPNQANMDYLQPTYMQPRMGGAPLSYQPR
jgi:hypothetical protein